MQLLNRQKPEKRLSPITNFNQKQFIFACKYKEQLLGIKMNLIKDDVRKLFYRFLIPAVSSAVAVAIYSLVDTIAIGQGVGPEGTAACALLLPVFSIASFIALLCGIGGSVLMSRARGEGNEEKGNAYFTVATVLVSVLTLVVWLFGNIFCEPFYRLCGADDILLPYTEEYGS